MAYPTPRILNVNGRVIKIAHLDVSEFPVTYLLTAMTATDTAATVISNMGFANTNLVLIGELGVDGTEFRSVNAAVTDGTALTLTAVTYAHPAGTPIRRVLFNQWKIYGTSTSTFSTANLVATVNANVSEDFTTYVNTGTEYSYYWAVAYDSVNATTGANSDGVASTGYTETSVGSLIDNALRSTKKVKSNIITDDWFFKEIDECGNYVRGKLKHWSFLQTFDYVLGQAQRGIYSFTLPSDIDDPNSEKSILGVRIGDSTNLSYKDKREWEDELEGVIRTQVRTQATAGDTTLEIDNSYDFADSGSVNYYISGTKYTITYTGVTRSATAGVLTGVPASGTGAITVTTPVDTNIWYGEDEGETLYYTIYDGSLYIWPMVDTVYDNANVYVDYWTGRTNVNSAGDTIDTKRYDLFKNWLCWKLDCLDNPAGELKMDNGFKIQFDILMNDLVSKEHSGQKFKLQRKVNTISY